MAEQIKLAEFSMDMEGVISEAEEYKETLDDLKEQRKQMKKDNETSSKAYVKLEASIKSVNKEYKDRLKVIQNSIDKTSNQTDRTKKLNTALEFQGTTIKELRDNNKALNKLRNSANIETEEGRKELARLNEKLDENNAKIKENVDAYTKQKINIGNYTDSVVDAYKEIKQQEKELTENISTLKKARSEVDKNSDEWVAYTLQINKSEKELDDLNAELDTQSETMDDTSDASDVLTEGLGELTGSEIAAGGAAELASGGFKGAMTAMAGFTRAALAFIATPVGAVLTAIALGFLAIRTAIRRSEDSLARWQKAIAPLKGALNELLDALTLVGDFMINSFIINIERAERALKSLNKYAEKVFRFLGMQDAADKMRDLRNAFEEASSEAKALAENEQRLREMTRSQIVMSAKLKAKQEGLRRDRDDELNSIQDRIKANKELGEVIEQQLKAELAQAHLAYTVAQQRILVQGGTTENLDARAEALARIYEIRGDINSREAEFVTNRANLLKEHRAKLKEQAQERIDHLNTELELMQANFGWQAKTLQDQLKQAQEVADEKLKILKEQLKSGLITQTEYQLNVLKIENEMEEKRANTAIEIARRQMEAEVELLQKKQTEEHYLNDEELQRLIGINNRKLEVEKQFQQKRLEQGLITEREYQAAIENKRNEIEEKNKQLRGQRAALEREEEQTLEMIRFQEEIAQMKARNANKFDIKMAQINEQYDNELAALNQKLKDEEISERVAAARKVQIEKERARAETKIRKAEHQAMVSSIAGALGAVANVVDENSATGKAIAVAQSLINVWQGLTSALATPWPASIAAWAQVAAMGFGAVDTIIGTEIPSASGKGNAGGGSGGGNPTRSNVPTSMGFETEGMLAENNATILNQLDANNLMGDLPEQVAQAVETGAHQGTQSGLVELSNNQDIAAQNEF